MTPGMRRQVVRWTILVLVLTQVAVSAYACPSYSHMGLTGQQPETWSTASVDAAMAMTESKGATVADSSEGPILNCDGMLGRLDAAAPSENLIVSYGHCASPASVPVHAPSFTEFMEGFLEYVAFNTEGRQDGMPIDARTPTRVWLFRRTLSP